MKRLLKKASETIYNIKGLIKFTECNSFDNEIYDSVEGIAYIDELNEALNEEIKEMGSKGLAEYIDPNYDKLEEGLITNISIKAVGQGDEVYSITTVKTTRELTEQEKKSLIDYVSRQYSDGFGEGFELVAIAEWTDQIEVIEDGYEDENGDWQEDEPYYEDAKFELFAHLWSTSTTYTFE